MDFVGVFCSTIISASGIDICVEIMLVIIIRVKNFSEIISIIISEKIFGKYYLRRDSAAAKILYI